MKILSILIILFGIFITACGWVILSIGMIVNYIFLLPVISIILGWWIIWYWIKLSRVNLWISKELKWLFYILFIIACILQILYASILYQATYHGL